MQKTKESIADTLPSIITHSATAPKEQPKTITDEKDPNPTRQQANRELGNVAADPDKIKRREQKKEAKNKRRAEEEEKEKAAKEEAERAKAEKEKRHAKKEEEKKRKATIKSMKHIAEVQREKEEREQKEKKKEAKKKEKEKKNEPKKEEKKTEEKTTVEETNTTPQTPQHKTKQTSYPIVNTEGLMYQGQKPQIKKFKDLTEEQQRGLGAAIAHSALDKSSILTKEQAYAYGNPAELIKLPNGTYIKHATALEAAAIYMREGTKKPQTAAGEAALKRQQESKTPEKEEEKIIDEDEDNNVSTTGTSVLEPKVEEPPELPMTEVTPPQTTTEPPEITEDEKKKRDTTTKIINKLLAEKLGLHDVKDILSMETDELKDFTPEQQEEIKKIHELLIQNTMEEGKNEAKLKALKKKLDEDMDKKNKNSYYNRLLNGKEGKGLAKLWAKKTQRADIISTYLLHYMLPSTLKERAFPAFVEEWASWDTKRKMMDLTKRNTTLQHENKTYIDKWERIGKEKRTKTMSDLSKQSKESQKGANAEVRDANKVVATTGTVSRQLQSDETKKNIETVQDALKAYKEATDDQIADDALQKLNYAMEALRKNFTNNETANKAIENVQTKIQRASTENDHKEVDMLIENLYFHASGEPKPKNKQEKREIYNELKRQQRLANQEKKTGLQLKREFEALEREVKSTGWLINNKGLNGLTNEQKTKMVNDVITHALNSYMNDYTSSNIAGSLRKMYHLTADPKGNFILPGKSQIKEAAKTTLKERIEQKKAADLQEKIQNAVIEKDKLIHESHLVSMQHGFRMQDLWNKIYEIARVQPFELNEAMGRGVDNTKTLREAMGHAVVNMLGERKELEWIRMDEARYNNLMANQNKQEDDIEEQNNVINKQTEVIEKLKEQLETLRTDVVQKTVNDEKEKVENKGVKRKEPDPVVEDKEQDFAVKRANPLGEFKLNQKQPKIQKLDNNPPPTTEEAAEIERRKKIEQEQHIATETGEKGKGKVDYGPDTQTTAPQPAAPEATKMEPEIKTGVKRPREEDLTTPPPAKKPTAVVNPSNVISNWKIDNQADFDKQMRDVDANEDWKIRKFMKNYFNTIATHEYTKRFLNENHDRIMARSAKLLAGTDNEEKKERIRDGMERMESLKQDITSTDLPNNLEEYYKTFTHFGRLGISEYQQVRPYFDVLNFIDTSTNNLTNFSYAERIRVEMSEYIDDNKERDKVDETIQKKIDMFPAEYEHKVL